MKIIIAGSRDITDYPLLKEVMIKSNAINKITEVVSGTARGVDRLGERWADEHGIPIKRFPADWDKFGKSAGYKRNKEMAEYSSGLVVLWNGSPGTGHMIDLARGEGLKVYVYRV